MTISGMAYYLTYPILPCQVHSMRLLPNQACQAVGRHLGLERFQPDWLAVAGRIAPGPALRLLAIARYVASPRLVPQAIRLGLD